MPTYGEVTSTAGPYLPLADPASWHLPGASGRFDREFRLLREDTTGQIRDACQQVLRAVRGSFLDADRHYRPSTNFNFCNDAKIQLVTMSKEHGIEFTVGCKQPSSTSNMTDEERQAWWEQCKRFRPGTVVCIFDTAGFILHFVVSESTLRGPSDTPDAFATSRKKFSLTGDADWFFINLNLVDSSELRTALQLYRETKPTWWLLDFPEVTLASFKHTLDALQRNCQSPHRLISLLNTDAPHTPPGPEVERPTYSRTPGFTFKLDCLMQHEQTFEFDPRRTCTAAEVASFADLEPYQARALLKSLSREVAMINGRPRTGKSYVTRKIIKAMVHNRDQADLGPTVCIFHDDNDLDCMVDQLLDDGIEQIVRVGGLSDEGRLQSLNLPSIHCVGMCSQEVRAEEQMAMFQDKLVSDIDRMLLRLSKIEPPRHSFEMLRRALLQDYQDNIINDLTRKYEEYEEIRSELPRFHDDARRQALQEAQVVAVTIGELARSPELLQTIHAKVLVCDDAGKFLEAETLTAILPSTEHVILIGDCTQRQLRFQNVEQISPEGRFDKLDYSLFHRLALDPYCHLPLFSPSSLNAVPACGRSHPDCVHTCQRTHGDSECGPCHQPCDVCCPHSGCTMPCTAPCNWVPCPRRCSLLLDCGHQCPSLCGEVCPDSKYCQLCGVEDILFTVVDGLGMKDYRDVDLDQDPCIFPHCGHFQTRSFMDQQLGIQEFYNLDEDGAPTSIKALQTPFSIQKIPCCIQCRGPLCGISRYGRITRLASLNKSYKELIIWSDGTLSELNERLARGVQDLSWSVDYGCIPTPSDDLDLPIKLNGNMQSQILVLRDFVKGNRYADLAVLYENIQRFSRKLKAEVEVFRKAAGLTGRADENNNTSGHLASSVDLQWPSPQLSGDLVTMNLSVRCNIAILSDFLELWKAKFTNEIHPRPTIEVDMTFNLRDSRRLSRRAVHDLSVAAQGYVYYAWFNGFARAMGVWASTRRQDLVSAVPGNFDTWMAESRISDNHFKSEGLKALNEAEALILGRLVSGQLRDEISATDGFIRRGCPVGVAENGLDTADARVLICTGPWHVCGNGHSFMDFRVESTFLGQPRCPECGLIVADNGHESEEGATPDVDAGLPSQGETLVDI